MEWKEYKLSEVCENIYSGGTPSSLNPSYWNGNLPWLSSGETRQRYIYKTEKYITEEGAKKSSTRFAYKGSTVVASAGQGFTRGQASMLRIDTYINQSVLVLKPNPSKINPSFLYFNLDSRYDELRQLSDGVSTRGSLSGRILKDLPILLPSIEDQHRIAAILSSLDDKIENNNRINANLETQALAIFDSWFGEGFETIKLSDICLNITDGVHNTVVDDKNGEYLLLSCKNIVGGKLKIGKEERRINRETFDKLRKRTKLAQGDILVSTVGTIGEIVMLFDDPANIEFQRSVGLIKPDITKATSAYIYCALKRKQNALKHVAHGAVQQCIFIGDLKDFEIPYSSIDKIGQFDTIVSPMFSQIASILQENQRLAALRDTLLPKLMKGEIEL